MQRKSTYPAFVVFYGTAVIRLKRDHPCRVTILAAGQAEGAHPPASVLARLHPVFYGGLILLSLGGLLLHPRLLRPTRNEYPGSVIR